MGKGKSTGDGEDTELVLLSSTTLWPPSLPPNTLKGSLLVLDEVPEAKRQS